QLEHLTNLRGLRQGEIDRAIESALSSRRLDTLPGVGESSLLRVATLALRSGRPVTRSLLQIPEATSDDVFLRLQAQMKDYDVYREFDSLHAHSEQDILSVKTAFSKLAEGSLSHADLLAKVLAAKLGYFVTD